jgi:hypothetical protein
LSAGKGYVDVSTIDPATAADVAAAVRATGALYLEAPVSGSKGPAEQGALIFLTAGALQYDHGRVACVRYGCAFDKIVHTYIQDSTFQQEASRAAQRPAEQLRGQQSSLGDLQQWW